MTTPPFQPGFRISATDIAVLVAGAIGSFLAAQAEWWMSLVIGFAVGHFFLFCNVFRVARPLELAWATLFVALAGSTITTEMPGWSITIATMLVATLVVVVLQLCKPSYHGIAWKRINPDLPHWWEEQGSGLRRNKR